MNDMRTGIVQGDRAFIQEILHVARAEFTLTPCLTISKK